MIVCIIGGLILIAAGLYGNRLYTFGNFDLVECRAARAEIEGELRDLEILRDTAHNPEQWHILNARCERLAGKLNRLNKRIDKLGTTRVNA